MIRIEATTDINWHNLEAVAYRCEALEIDPALLDQVDVGREKFLQLIADGVPCYGVTTGLGKLVTVELDEQAKRDIPFNILRARSVAIGAPFSKPVARAIMFLRLVNFLSGRDGVRSELCRYLVDRLNDDFVPWIPSLGHGMAADAIANTHAFQTFIGEGFIYGPDNQRQVAADGLAARGVKHFELKDKEGLALLNGITAAPACALDAHRRLSECLKLANLIAAVSIEGLAADKGAYHSAVKQCSAEAGVAKVIDALQAYLAGSEITPFKLQSPVSFRVTPQVHGALQDALDSLQQRIESCFSDFSDNPLMHDDLFLSVGVFHNQHLVNQIEHVALALAHVGSLSEHRLHRLLSSDNTGLNAQLAMRPGLDAGLVVTQKASIDLSARLRVLAQPISLLGGETSAGQEDYMSMAIPAVMRLYEMAGLLQSMLAYELLAGITALRMRDQAAGAGVKKLVSSFASIVPPSTQDRSPGPDVEAILEHFASVEFDQLLTSLK